MFESDFIKELYKEISPQDAPVTGYYISCAIETELGVYIDHNVEDAQTLMFQHAEEGALTQVLKKESSPKIKRVVMYGEGKVKKRKHYVPCMYCSKKLAPYTDHKTIISLLPSANLNEVMTLKFSKVLSSYDKLGSSNLFDMDEKQMNENLQSHTPLKKEDRKFILALIKLCVANEISLYLTGSASGRGGFSTFINNTTGRKYGDIDLLFVLSKGVSWKAFLFKIETLVQVHYDHMNLLLKNVPAHHNRNGVVLGMAHFYTDDEKEPLVDVFFSTRLSGAFIKSEYEENNWFHELTPN